MRAIGTATGRFAANFGRDASKGGFRKPGLCVTMALIAPGK